LGFEQIVLLFQLCLHSQSLQPLVFLFGQLMHALVDRGLFAEFVYIYDGWLHTLLPIDVRLEAALLHECVFLFTFEALSVFTAAVCLVHQAVGQGNHSKR